MDVLQAIRTRRTTKSFKAEPVPRAVIEQLLDAANWAPNHKLTQPWKFTVLEGAARTTFASLRRALTTRDATARGMDPAKVAEMAETDAAKVLRAPTVILVSCSQRGDAIQQEEDVVATAAAVENMLLAATAMGIGTFWSSGPIAYAPELLTLFGLEPTDKVIGVIQIGYSDDPPSPKRAPAAAYTRWVAPHEVPFLVRKIDSIVNNGHANTNGHTGH